MLYRMNKPMGKLGSFPTHLINNQARMQFMLMCLWYSRAFDEAPMSLKIALDSMFRKSINYMTMGLKISLRVLKSTMLSISDSNKVSGNACHAISKSLGSIFRAT